MHEPALVSIVTPCFNAERYLEETIESVFDQTYSRWELLLVDDGSGDHTEDIARRWVASHPDRIRYLEHPNRRNQGTSASRNLGMRHAQGEFVAFLDADDIWLRGHLAGQVELLKGYPEVGLVYGPTEEWYGWTGRPEDRARDHVLPLQVATGQPLIPPGPLAAFVRREAPSPCTCSVVARRSVADATGGFEASFRGMYDDQVFYAKACLAAPVLAGAECSSRYRRRPDSLYSWAKTTDQHRSDRLAFLRWLDRYVAEHGGGSAELVSAVRRELWTARHPTLSRFLAGFRLWT